MGNILPRQVRFEIRIGEFVKVVDILEKIKSTSKSTEKLAIMKDHARNRHFKSVLHYANNPFKPFHVSKVPRVKNADRNTKILEEEDCHLH